MDDTDKIVAATLAAARCTGYKAREEYVTEHEAFLQLLEQRGMETKAKADASEIEKTIETFSKL